MDGMPRFEEELTVHLCDMQPALAFYHLRYQELPPSISTVSAGAFDWR